MPLVLTIRSIGLLMVLSSSKASLPPTTAHSSSFRQIRLWQGGIESAPDHASNQSFASPVKDRYSPNAVSAQDTVSTSTSNWMPRSPITCASEIKESASAAESAQRGQLFLRRAASQTK